MNLEQEFIPYQEALELKELGFDEPCFGCYDEKSVFGLTVMSIKQYYTNSKEDAWNCAAPTFSQAFRWFRKKYGLHYYITTHDETDYEWYIYDKYQNDWEDDATQDTYEEAELGCLRKLIEIVKQEQ